MDGRGYIVLIATPYSNDPNGSTVSRTDEHSTWILVFQQNGASKWHTGDVLRITYPKTTIPGVDFYTFTPSSTSKAKDDGNNKPNLYQLSQNFPNPFNPNATIRYSVPKSGNVLLQVYDALGREIMTLVNEAKTAGNYEISFKAGNLPSGVYFYRMKSGSFVDTKKMLLLK